MTAREEEEEEEDLVEGMASVDPHDTCFGTASTLSPQKEGTETEDAVKEAIFLSLSLSFSVCLCIFFFSKP